MTPQMVNFIKKAESDTVWPVFRAGESVDWKHPLKCHDWRNHVPEEIQQLWSEIPPEGQAAVVLMASNLADKEEWE